ncbi:tripartite tricarboxylate transporter TctB family protein [Pseudochelatococcus sp. B33]
MQRAHIILPALLTGLGAVILWQSLFKMDYFYVNRGAPGPGFLPFWVSLGVVVLGGLLTIRASASGSAPADVEWPDRSGWRRIGIVLGGFLLFLIFVGLIGFTLSTIAFLAGVSYLLGMRRLIIVLPVAVGVGLFLHIVFGTWLRISLPIGLLGRQFQEVAPWIF